MTNFEKCLAYGVMFLLTIALVEWVNRPATGAEHPPLFDIGVDKDGHPIAP